MPFVTVRDYKPTIRKGLVKNKSLDNGEASGEVLSAGMPMGLLLAITYSTNTGINPKYSTDDILVSGRITQNTVNIRVKTD